MRSKCSSVRSSKLLTCSWKAALLTRMSSLPNSSTVFSTASLQNSGSATSPGQQDAAAAFLLDRALGLLGVLVLVEIGQRDVGALAGEQHRHRPADAGVAAGDQRNLVEQLLRAFVVRRVVHRLELEIGLKSRLA